MKCFKNATVYVEGEGLKKTTVCFDEKIQKISRCADKTAEVIELPENAVAYDLYVYENNLYVLCNLLTEEGYTVTVYRYLSKGDEFIRETAFKSAIPAVSFACDDTAFYFGMASNNFKHTDHGRILKIEK